MKPKLMVCLLVASLSLTWFGAARSSAATAQVKLANDSLRVHRGQCNCGLGLTYYLYFSTYYTEEVSQANEELAPMPAGAGYNHWSYLILEDVSMSTSVTLAQLNLPSQDSNGDGVIDFLDLSRAANTTTYGTFQSSLGPGTLSAAWSRAAGSSQGTCDLTLDMPILGLLGPFHHTFDVVQYSGGLAYTPGSNTVSGTLTVTLAGDATQQIQGPVEWLKSPTNRFNSLVLQSGSWTDANAGVLTFAESEFTRSPTAPSTYRGQVKFDGGPYQSWTLTFTDANDANHNGIPDFSDDPVPPLPQRPALSLARGPNRLELSIRGDVGRTHFVQEALSLTASNWSTIQTLTLTNDPQTVWLPLSSGPAKFWRVTAQ